MNSNVTQLSVGRPAAHFPTAFSCVCFSLLGTWIILHLHRTYQHRVHSSWHSATPAPTGPTPGHRVRLSALSLYVGSGNLLGMYICLVLSLHYNYSSVTATTCVGRSPADYPVNYFPSISACIGDHFPQVSVWRSTVMVVEFFRWGSALAFYLHFDHALRPVPGGPTVNRGRLVATLLESVFNIGLSACSSSDSIKVHEVCFAGYCASHATMMALSIVLTRWKLRAQERALAQLQGRGSTGTELRSSPPKGATGAIGTTRTTGTRETREAKEAPSLSTFGHHADHVQLSPLSLEQQVQDVRQEILFTTTALRHRIRVATVNVSSLIGAVYFYVSSQGSMCTVSGWYSMFAVCEWCYVWSGAVFHFLECIELREVTVCIDLGGGGGGRSEEEERSR